LSAIKSKRISSSSPSSSSQCLEDIDKHRPSADEEGIEVTTDSQDEKHDNDAELSSSPKLSANNNNETSSSSSLNNWTSVIIEKCAPKTIMEWQKTKSRDLNEFEKIEKRLTSDEREEIILAASSSSSSALSSSNDDNSNQKLKHITIIEKRCLNGGRAIFIDKFDKGRSRGKKILKI